MKQILSAGSSLKDVLVNCNCASSSAQIDVKLLSVYKDFCVCIPLCLLVGANSQFIGKKLWKQRSTAIVRYQEHQFS